MESQNKIMDEYASARRVPHVGRKEILDLIEKYLTEKSDQTRVIYITAEGGMGKTYLLQQILQPKGGQSRAGSKVLSVSRLIDLYHTHLHTHDGLITAIIDALFSEPSDPRIQVFKEFFSKRAALTHKELTGGSISGLREEMENAFVEGMNALAEKKYKLFLVFDTAEALTYATDPAQKALGLANRSMGMAPWLIKNIISQLHNAVIVIAGRPENSKQLAAQLKRSVPQFYDYKLPSFSDMETLDFFMEAGQMIRKENLWAAKSIESIPLEIRLQIHGLTKGKPFLLALLVDLLAISERFPPLEETTPKTFPDYLRDWIVEAIKRSGRPLDGLVDTLSWTPKGMGAQLLAWVQNHHRADDAELNQTKQQIDFLRSMKPPLSFVKLRAEDDLVFLQDEMYRYLWTAHSDPHAEHRRSLILADIDAFYKMKINEIQGKIKAMEKGLNNLWGRIEDYQGTKKDVGVDFQSLSVNQAEDLPQVWSSGLAPQEEKWRLTRARLQAYQVEHLYYGLQLNLIEGYKTYLEYSAESFQSRELELWRLLREEILRFAADNKEKLSSYGLSIKDIAADMGIHWVRYSLAQDNLTEAETRAWRLREKLGKDILKPGSYADLELKLLEISILAYRTGKDPEKARDLLNEILNDVKRLPDKTDLDKWRVNFLNAHARYWYGYFFWAQGKFKEAVKWYRLALPLWRDLEIEVQAATTLNDLAWAEAETGAFGTALAHCRDGLELRRQLGKPYLVAFSHNTMGLIQTRMGNPEVAIPHCEKALRIFRRLEDSRGSGLACRALAESLRRTATGDMLAFDEEKQIEHLKSAAERAEEAVNIFSEQLKNEPLRLVETNIELGCVFREWIRLLDKTDPEWEDKSKRSLAAYERAVKVARKTGYEYRAIDALVNMAWLYYYMGDRDKAREILLNRVRNALKDEYLFTTEHSVIADAPDPWNWVQLGKANVLLGRMFFDEFKEAHDAGDQKTAELKLQQAAHNWTLSMAYNSLYGDSFRDFNKGREVVYNRLKGLNPSEMNCVRSSMERTFNEYHIPETQRAFDQFLKERFQE